VQNRGFKVEVVNDVRDYLIRLHINEMNFDILRGTNRGILERMSIELMATIRHAIASENN
jgi:hypothetical protein